MANQNAPHGFEPVHTFHGGAMLTEEFFKAATVTHAAFRNDIFARDTGSGTNSEGRIVGILLDTTTFTPGTTLESGVLLNSSLASTAADHQAIVDPMLMMEGQDDGVGGGIVAANPGKNANISLAVAGQFFGTASGRQGLSGQQIGQASIAVTATLDLHLIELLQVSEALGGNAFGANARVIVSFNRHRMSNQVVGV